MLVLGGGGEEKGGSPWCPINLVAVDKTPPSQHSLALESLRQHWPAERRGSAPLTHGGPCFGASQTGQQAAPTQEDAQIQMRLLVREGQGRHLLRQGGRPAVQVCPQGGMWEALLVRASHRLCHQVIILPVATAG